MTASGHRILINPKKQKAIFQNFIEGMLAESHFYFNERAISYGEYRSGRGQKNVGGSSVRIVQSVRKQLDKLDDKTFVKLDIGILRLEQQPAPLKSKAQALSVVPRRSQASCDRRFSGHLQTQRPG
jgi:hypothetical protein